MSKSTRFLRLASLRDWGVHPLVYRYFLLAAHYRSKLTFSFDALVGTRSVLLRLLRGIGALRETSASFQRTQSLVAETRFSRGASFEYAVSSLSRELGAAASSWVEKLDESVSRDLNTPTALANLPGILDDKALTPDEVVAVLGIYDLVLGLGLLEVAPEALLMRPAAATLTDAEVDALVTERRQARASGEYKRGDEIRDRLKREGIALSDGTNSTRWEWMPALPKTEA